MVVSPHYLASAAGSRILQQGGNAFDAAVAVSACLAVVYPHMTGLGGDSFWLTYSSQEGKVRAYNASGRSGSRVTAACFAGESAIPQRGPRSVIAVPGMVDGWDAVLREYGSKTLAEVLEPAIYYALEGFPLSPNQHVNTAERFEVLEAYPQTAAIYLPGGRSPSRVAALCRLLWEAACSSLRITVGTYFIQAVLVRRLFTHLRSRAVY